MADLVTHVGLALLVKGAAGRRHSASFVLGNVLPDLAGRAVGMGLSLLANRGLPVPEELIFGFGVLHLPLGMLAFSALLALPFRRGLRRGVFLKLTAGSVISEKRLFEEFKDHQAMPWQGCGSINLGQIADA